MKNRLIFVFALIFLFSKNTVAVESFNYGPSCSTIGQVVIDDHEATPFGPNALREIGVEWVQVGDHVRIIIPSDHLFEINSSRLCPCAVPILTSVSKFVKQYPTALVTVTAYTDEVGDPCRKLKLSLRQAQRVMGFLWAHCENYMRMTALGYGNSHHIADNSTPTGSAYNRRVEIAFIMPEVVH